MENQNYNNHRRLDPLYHYAGALLALFVLIGSLVQLVRSILHGESLMTPLLLLAAGLLLIIYFIKIRGYALLAQDRAIRAEEQLRYFILTGKRLDPRLTIKQLVSLRFASDEEYPELASKAANESMKPDDIKKAIRSWRADTYRI